MRLRLALIAAILVAAGCAEPVGRPGSRPLVLRDEETGGRLLVPPEHAEAVRSRLTQEAPPPDAPAETDEVPPAQAGEGRWTKVLSFVIVAVLALAGLALALPKGRRGRLR